MLAQSASSASLCPNNLCHPFAAEKFLLESKLLTLAESLGGVESLAKLAWTTASPLSDEDRLASGMTRDLLRVSIGLEDVDDLIADLDMALKKAHA